jgi:serine/threonine-protein kinase
MSEEPPRAVGPYPIVDRLGRGGSGRVYRALEPARRRPVAVKVLPAQFGKDPERAERFVRAAETMATIRHPNLVQVVDHGRDGDLHYLVMEWVPDATTLDLVLRERRLALPEALRIFKGICRGLEAAHRRDLAHRDLNPRNVLVSRDLSVVKLGGFGASRLGGTSRLEGTISTSETSMGTLHYMAPELLRDMTTSDPRSDVYSLGVTLYEMLTGRLPVGRFGLPSQLQSAVPPDLDPVVLKCVAANPAERYPTVTKLLEEIARLEDRLRLGLVDELRGIRRSTAQVFSRSGPTAGGRRGPLVVAVVVAVVLALAVVAYLLLGR